MGKAANQIRERWESYTDWIEDQCYEKAYGLGRYWKFDTPKYPDLLAFWYTPSPELVEKVAHNLNIDHNHCVLVLSDSNKDEIDVTVQEYIDGGVYGGSNFGDENIEEMIQKPFRLDSKVVDLIRSYNQPNETWQSRKEKEGWNTLAQRNATIYQEEKKTKNTIKDINSLFKNDDKYEK